MASVVNISGPKTPPEYMRALAEFVTLEDEIGGPDPHLATLGEMMRDVTDLQERVWRVGCYAAGYNVPTAEAIWRAWPYERVLEDIEALPGWVDTHWEGIGFRRERRAVRSREKFSRCLTSIAYWVNEVETYDWWQEDDYEAAWESSGKIYGLGRYVQLKFLEGLLRYCDGKFTPKDIRPIGGKTPRATLALLYPSYEKALRGNDSRENIAWANMCANWTREVLTEQYGAPYLDYFRLQVVLCEGGKCFVGRQYCGSTHDSELRYHLAAQKYWGHDTTMLRAREAIFDKRVLGELNGWWGKREELGSTLPLHGYLWTDFSYDYFKTGGNLAKPVAWTRVTSKTKDITSPVA